MLPDFLIRDQSFIPYVAISKDVSIISHIIHKRSEIKSGNIGFYYSLR